MKTMVQVFEVLSVWRIGLNGWGGAIFGEQPAHSSKVIHSKTQSSDIGCTFWVEAGESNTLRRSDTAVGHNEQMQDNF